MRDIFDVIIIPLIGLIMFGFCFNLGIEVSQRQAYKAGVGHHVVDGASGETHWVFECQVCDSNKLAAAALAKEEQAD